MADVPARLTDALAGRYRIEHLLGSGGMADVYLAQDLKHPRRVAIKVLKPELAALLGRERFLREIELAATLQHPYVLALWDSGVAGDLLYYVMPYLEGDTLRRRLEREKQLPLEAALRITGEVAEALDYAHQHGVVHRDIKPENILFEGGHAVVADFGIARAVGLAGGTQLTETGVTLGTPTYMSTEQALGGRELDGRSDQYSLACVAYEMLAGQPPFTGATAESIVHQHLSVTARPVTDLRATVPGGVAVALNRALAKAPADRYGSAGELARAVCSPSPMPPRRRGRLLALVAVWLVATGGILSVWRWSELRGRPAAPDPSQKDLILVAQFDGPTNDPELALAVRSMIMTAVDQSGIAATVPDAYLKEALKSAGRPDSTRVDATLARELAQRRSIRAVLEGQVGRLGQGYSLTTRLIDVEDGFRLLLSAAETAEDGRQLIPAAERLARRLRAALGEQRAALRASRPLLEISTPNFEAYRLFIRGVEAGFTDGDNSQGVRLLRAAIALDPEFGAAWQRLSMNYGNMGKRDSARWAFEQAQRYASRLADFDRLVLEWTEDFHGRRDIAAAVTALERMRSANLTPSQLGAYYNQRGVVMSAVSRLDEACESFQLALEQPSFARSHAVMHNVYLSLMGLGRFDEAQSMAQQLTTRGSALARLEVVRERWAQAESIGTATAADPTTPLRTRHAAAVAAASGSLAQGRVARAARILDATSRRAETAGDVQLARLSRDHEASLAWFAGSKLPTTFLAAPIDTSLLGTLSRVFMLHIAGRTPEAASGLRRLLADPRSAWPEYAPRVRLLPGWTALAEGSVDEGVALLRGLAFPTGGPIYFNNDELQASQHARWLMAGAYERMDRPDSAAISLETLLAPVGNYRDRAHYRGFFFSFAHQRLVLLYARMGRLDAARLHWEAFQRAFTDPDPELRPLVNEARAALAATEGVSRGTRR